VVTLEINKPNQDMVVNFAGSRKGVSHKNKLKPSYAAIMATAKGKENWKICKLS